MRLAVAILERFTHCAGKENGGRGMSVGMRLAEALHFRKNVAQTVLGHSEVYVVAHFGI